MTELKSAQFSGAPLDKAGHLFDGCGMKQPRATNQGISSPLIVQLDSRDVALWLGESGSENFDAEKAAWLCRLPWNVVLSQSSDEQFLAQLEADESVGDALVRRRGLIHVVDSDPADTPLPPRHLAIFLLNGRSGQRRTGPAALTRRLTMLQDLRRRSIKQLVIVIPGAFAVPDDFGNCGQMAFAPPSRS